MNVLTMLGNWGGSAAFTIAAFLVVLTIVVFVHEMGHFLVGRWAGIKVEAFAIGFGPELFGWNDRHGTRWKVCAIPLGGYVKFFGDLDAASSPDFARADGMSAEQKAQSFFHKSVGKRAAVVAAGPFANFLLAIVVFAGLFMGVGKQIVLPRIADVVAGSAAEKAGIKPGDVVKSIDGRAIESFSDMQRIVMMAADQPLALVVERGGSDIALTATPRLHEDKDRFGSVYRIGLLGVSSKSGPEDISFRRYGPLEAVAMGVKETWFIIAQTGTFMRDVIVGRQSTEQLGGPIKIARVSGEVAQVGIVALLGLVAMLSVSIGLLNLLPIPVLDGGHLAFYALEAVLGRPVNDLVQDYSFRFGMALMLMLMLFVTWNDLKGFVG